MKKGTIFCEGVVDEVCEHFVRVRTGERSAAACSGCAAHGLCGSGDGQVIEVPSKDASEFHKGDKVRMSVSESYRFRAIVLCLVLPAVVLCVAAGCLLAAGMSDGVAALSAIGAAAVYFILLRLLRGRLAASADGWRLERIDD